MRRASFTRSALLLMSVLALVACGGDDDNDDDDPFGPGEEMGTMTATVTGDVSETFTGEGFFAADEADDTWAIYMGGDEEDESAVWFWGEGGRPGTGPITLTFDGSNGGWFVHGASGTLYYAESGTLTLTTSSASTVAGSFDFTGSDFSGGEVSVEGTFNIPNWTDELQ